MTRRRRRKRRALESVAGGLSSSHWIIFQSCIPPLACPEPGPRLFPSPTGQCPAGGLSRLSGDEEFAPKRIVPTVPLLGFQFFLSCRCSEQSQCDAPHYGNILLLHAMWILRKAEPRMLYACSVTKASVDSALPEQQHTFYGILGPTPSRNCIKKCTETIGEIMREKEQYMERKQWTNFSYLQRNHHESCVIVLNKSEI